MDIRKDISGKLVRLPSGYQAFVPNPLPPEIEWSDQLVGALSRADYMLGNLAREGEKLPNPKLLLRPFVTREAVLSSKIEGTQATLGEVLAYDAGMPVRQSIDELLEVQNYVVALEFGLKRLSSLPLSLRLIREVHEKLMSGVRGTHATPGEFRKIQNWIGSPGATLHTARFVPPPVDYLTSCLGEFESFLHEKKLPVLIHAALCHYQLETIHPFLDGNGRVGRLLIMLLLIERGALPGPLLYLSAFFEATRDEYYRRLFKVSSEGDWQEWLIYFLNGVALQSQDVLSRVSRINEKLDKWRYQIEGSRSSVAIDVLERLAINPYLTINKVSNELNVAYSTAERGVKKLLHIGVIEQVGDEKRDKVYCAVKILAILEEPAKIYADDDYR